MKKLLFLIAICLFISSNSFAWDDTGHKLTTYIAWAQMTPQAREKVFNLLMAAPEDADLSVFYLQGSRSEEAKRLELFMIASTWADIIRDNKNFKARNKKYHHGNWHYLDTLWSEENGKISIIPKTEEEGENAVERLFVFDKLMRDATKLDDDKAIALAWFLHLGGDIHQPLHCSGRVTSWAAKGDQGGNLFSLTPKDTPREKRENLHWYWDSIIGRNIPRVNDACDSDYLPKIAQEIVKKFPASKYANRLKIGKYDEWQKEGFELASKEVYKNGLKDFEMPSDKYKKRAYVISQEQIALAGYRMGQTLNEMFGK
jgi:S1/P1 Nuclease